MVIQIAAESEKVDSLLNILRPFGIRESVRTGHVAMTRGSSSGVRHTGCSGLFEWEECSFGRLRSRWFDS